jgi:hypothetical protein
VGESLRGLGGAAAGSDVGLVLLTARVLGAGLLEQYQQLLLLHLDRDCVDAGRVR